MVKAVQTKTKFKLKTKSRLKLLPKLIISLGVMGVVLTIVISQFSYYVTKSYLEDQFAERVKTNSNAIAAMLSPDDVKTVISEGGDKTEEYTEMCALFNKLKKDGEITYLSLTVPDEDSVTFYIDAMVEEMGDLPENQMAYGTDVLYTDAANPDDPEDYQKYITIWNCFADNKGLDTPAITDNSYGYNYTGIAVVLDENGTAIAEIQYILDMNEVHDYLSSFMINMLLISFFIILLTVGVYVIFVRHAVTKPIGKLARFTQNITDTGVFENQRISLGTGDEIEALGDSFNYMLEKLEDYIANLSKMTAEKERIGAELDIATHIQASMLPCIFPAFPERREFSIFATMTPAKEVGGDFYDFFMVDKRHLAVVVADVSGKGVPAALFMVIGKTLIKDHTEPDADLGNVFSEVNNILCESNSEGLFITAFEGVLDLVTGEFSYVNAGHEMPFICKNGKFKPIKIKAGFVLAGLEDMHYSAGSLMLEPGDRIFQYTDGVTEATDKENRLFGMERLEKSLNDASDKSPEELLGAVKKDIDAFVKEAPQFDDITMLCLDYRCRMEDTGEEKE
jgi:phosphoserine phosphatase RsbU/P